MSKICTMCRAELDENCFAKNKNAIDGLQKGCKECHKKYYRSYKEKFGPAFTVWKSMLQRCRDKNCKDYLRYGGRGIKVCKEWEDNVDVFTKWSYANGYKEGLTIDRIDNNGNYEPGNCCFISAAGNIRHRSTTVLDVDKVSRIKSLLLDGKNSDREIGEMFGVSRLTISSIKHGQAWKDVQPASDIVQGMLF